MSTDSRKALQHFFGYDAFLDNQESIIDDIMRRNTKDLSSRETFMSLIDPPEMREKGGMTKKLVLGANGSIVGVSHEKHAILKLIHGTDPFG